MLGHAFDQCGLQQRFSVSEVCPFSRNKILDGRRAGMMWDSEAIVAASWFGTRFLEWSTVKLFRSSSSS